MQRVAPLIVASAIFWICLGSSAHAVSAGAGRTLDLPSSWVQVVRPYEYVEARRFESGWNRGADVLVSAGRVQSPVRGVVRFAGVVAGRSVVTVSTRIGGAPTVVTFTDLEAIDVVEGASIGRGDLVGRGSLVHIGAYDARRRTRYLPVRAIGGIVPASAAHAADRAARSSLADGIADRLHAAILGEGWASSSTPSSRVFGAMPMPSSTTSSHVRVDPTNRMASVMSGTLMVPAGVSSSGTHGNQRRPLSHEDRNVQRGWGVPLLLRHFLRHDWRARAARPAHPGRVAHLPSVALDVGHAAGDSDPTGFGHPSPRQRTVVHATRPSSPMYDSSLVAAGDPTSGMATAPRIRDRLVDQDRSEASSHPRRMWKMAQTIEVVAPVIMLLLGVVAAVLARRRRRRRTDDPVPVRLPLPLHLPHVRPYAYPVVRTDGSSVLPDVAVAWSPRDVGTCPDTDPDALDRERAPEHA